MAVVILFIYIFLTSLRDGWHVPDKYLFPPRCHGNASGPDGASFIDDQLAFDFQLYCQEIIIHPTKYRGQCLFLLWQNISAHANVVNHIQITVFILYHAQISRNQNQKEFLHTHPTIVFEWFYSRETLRMFELPKPVHISCQTLISTVILPKPNMFTWLKFRNTNDNVSTRLRDNSVIEVFLNL